MIIECEFDLGSNVWIIEERTIPIICEHCNSVKDIKEYCSVRCGVLSSIYIKKSGDSIKKTFTVEFDDNTAKVCHENIFLTEEDAVEEAKLRNCSNTNT